MAATVRVKEFAELLGVSTWAVYESVRRRKCPVDPIILGRRIVWSRAAVERLLQIVRPSASPC